MSAAASLNEKKKYPRGGLLIANRGEIAIRIARSARALGFETIAVYSDADRMSEHVRACDRAVYIGESEPRLSYLNVEKVIAAAKATGARYVHPGYGFLSERPHFVEACEKAGLIFVGPSADSMRVMGDKITARATVERLKVPGVPGSPGAMGSAAEALAVARKIGFPVLLKATAGGGGKGMRRVDAEADVASAFESASREALGAFGDGSMYVEKYILEPHHVEIQVFGDGNGGAIHLGERECSIQRRHQKVWEEAPAPILELHPKTRAAMCEAAVRVASSIKYAGAGTFEFIVDGKGAFYFLEMNTRLQVEHPVSEWVTGVDLVGWQLLLASGEFKLPASPEMGGSAIEVRIYAEDPHHFLPAPGPIGLIEMPTGPFVRVDTAFRGSGEVSVHYDPMIAKLSVWGETRSKAVERLRVALDECRILAPRDSSGRPVGSLRTNLSFLRRLVRNRDAISGSTTTDLIAKNTDLTAAVASGVVGDDQALAIAVALDRILSESAGVALASAPDSDSGGGLGRSSAWRQVARREGVRD